MKKPKKQAPQALVVKSSIKAGIVIGSRPRAIVIGS